MTTPWEAMTDEQRWDFLRGDKGVGHGSRIWFRRWLAEHCIASVLDVGCATGVEYEGLKADALTEHVRYVGVDSNERMVELASERFGEATWLRGGAEELPCDDRSHEVVLLRHILEHLQDFRAALAEAWRAARKAVVCVFFLPLAAEEALRAEGGTHWNVYAARDVCGEAYDAGCRHSERVCDLGADHNMALVLWREGRR